MIKLYQFPAAWGLPNPSPYCMKLEVYMRLAEIPYEIVTWHDPRKAPKGKDMEYEVEWASGLTSWVEKEKLTKFCGAFTKMLKLVDDRIAARATQLVSAAPYTHGGSAPHALSVSRKKYREPTENECAPRSIGDEGGVHERSRQRSWRQQRAALRARVTAWPRVGA